MVGELHVLGPQRPRPNVINALRSLPGVGHVVLISAGWRIDETDAPRVLNRMGVPVVHLPLYAWHEELRGAAPDLERAWRARQDRVLALKQHYQLRLRYLLDGLVALQASQADDRWVFDRELVDAVESVRRLDTHLLQTMDEIHATFPAAATPWTHPAVAARHAQIAQALDGAGAVLVTGGNVGVLRNRLMYFGAPDLLAAAQAAGTAIVAWSAGCMALAERVVLFYDDPPEGPAWPELFDRGIGLLSGATFLPHARQRLRLGDQSRVALMAARFGPHPCIGLEADAWLVQTQSPAGPRWVNRGPAESAFALHGDGSITNLPTVEA